MKRVERKNIRLAEWDYASSAYYHITICTHARKCLLGRIQEGLDSGENPKTHLSVFGQCCQEVICSAEGSYCSIENYVIMPNHVHLLVCVNRDGSTSSSLSSFVRFIKSMTTRQARERGLKGSLWQKGFYDTVIRDEEHYLEVWRYIDENPLKWALDEYYED